MAITNMEDSPPRARIPKIDRIQSISKTPAICLKGLGKAPIKAQRTRRIKIFHKVIGWLFRVNNCRSGIDSPSILR